MNTTFYKRGVDFPHEGFVQISLEKHFENAGFEIGRNGHVDLFCTHPKTKETWQVEAKGKTTQIGLDFRTGIGQLLQGMDSEIKKYGIAVPDIEAFRTQVEKVSSWVVTALGIHWLFISEDGSIEIVSPKA